MKLEKSAMIARKPVAGHDRELVRGFNQKVTERFIHIRKGAAGRVLGALSG